MLPPADQPAPFRREQRTDSGPRPAGATWLWGHDPSAPAGFVVLIVLIGGLRESTEETFPLGVTEAGVPTGHVP